MFRRSWKKALAILVIVGFLLLLLWPIIARAAVGEEEFYKAAVLLNKYGLVQGDERGMRFFDDISRAEMAKLVVVAIGLESEIRNHTSRNDFADTRGHWAEAFIAVAKKAGLMRGYPEGDFRPGNPVSYAEVITVFSRLVGLEAGREAWPYTYVMPAREAGIIPDGMNSLQNLQGAAIRGDVFVLLKRTLVDVKNVAGQTLLQRYHDRTPPKIAVDPQPTETQTVRLTVTGTVKDAEQVRVNGTPVKLEFGYFQYTADLRLGPNTIRIQAVDLAGNLAEEVIRVDRVAGSAASIEFSGPKSVAAGQSAVYKLVVKDRNGEILADHSQVEATVTPDIGTFDIATGKFTAGTRAGQGTVTLSAGSAQASIAVSVTAGGLEHIAVAPAEISLAPGEKITFTAAGYDAQENPVPLTGLTWIATGGTIDVDGKFTASGSTSDVTISATAGGKTATARVRPLNYQVVGVRLSQPTRVLTADRQDTLSLTATLVDASGQPVTDYRGTLAVTSSAYGAVAPVQNSVLAAGGVATVELRAGSTAGTATVSVGTNLGKTGTASVTAAPQQLQMVRISAQPAPRTVNPLQNATIEAVALDTNGRPMVSPLSQTLFINITPSSDSAPPAAITFESNGQSTADIVLGPLDPTTGEVRTRMTVLYTAGTGTFTLGGAVRPQNLAYVQVLPGALVTGPALGDHALAIETIPNTVAGETRSIYVLIRDTATGRPITDGNVLAAHAITLRDQTGATWSPAVSAAAGQGRARFDVRQVKAGAYTYTATLLPGDATATGAASVDPGPVAGVKLAASAATIPADNTATSVLTAEVVDAYGNRVTTGAYPITFNKVAPATGATQAWLTNPAGNSAGGTATATVTAARVIATETYRATVPNANNPSQPFTATVTVTTRGAAERLRIRYGDNNGDGSEGGASDNIGRAGIPLTVITEVLDSFGNLVTYDNGTAITVTIRNMTTGAETPQVVTTAEGKAVANISNNLAGRFAIKAESGTLIKALTAGYGGAVADAEFRAGHTAGLRVTTDLFQLGAGALSSWTNVTVTLLDANGNVTTNQTGMAVTVTLQATPAGSGTFTTDDTVAGAQLAARTVTIPPGATESAPVRFYSLGAAGVTTIAASTLDGATAGANVSTVVIGPAAGLQAAPIDPVAFDPWTHADGTVTGQTVAVTAVDAAGDRATDFAGIITLTPAGDAVVVAYFDPLLGTWRSVDTLLGNGLGDYTGPYSVAADRGQAIFRVRANSPGYKSYTATTGGLATGPVLGRLDGPSPDHLTVQAASRKITGGGDQVSIDARVRDAAGNTLTYVTGTVSFKVAVTSGGPQPGALLTASAPLHNGVATAYFQSAGILDQDSNLTVSAWTEIKRFEGGVLTRGGSEAGAATDTFIVDATPRITGVTFGSTVANGLVSSGDTISLTFSEGINFASVGAVSTISFDQATSTIRFPGAASLGAINLNAGAIVNSNEYAVAAQYDGAARIIKITIGGKITPNPDTQAAAAGGSGSVVMTGAIRDAFGSGARGTTPVSISGNF